MIVVTPTSIPTTMEARISPARAAAAGSIIRKIRNAFLAAPTRRIQEARPRQVAAETSVYISAWSSETIGPREINRADIQVRSGPSINQLFWIVR
jgi:hypothetical protein